MGAIGNYVHMLTKNYDKYGAARQPNTDYYQATSNYVEQRMKAIPKIQNSATINELRQRLKANSTVSIRQDQLKTDKDLQERIDKIFEDFAMRLPSTVAGRFYGQLVKNSTLQYSQGKFGKGDAIIQKAKETMNRIDKKIDEINRHGQPSEAELQALLNEYNQAYNTSYTLRGGDVQSVFGAIQKEFNQMKEMKFGYTLFGDFGEMVAAMCDDSVMKTTKEEFIKAIKSKIVGSETSKVVYEEGDFGLGDRPASNFYEYSDETGTYISKSETQNKVDIIIDVNQETVYGSVKYYGDTNANRLHLQNVSLFDALVAISRSLENFSNHWLNLHAGYLHSNRANADEVLKQELAYEALASGNPFKRDAKIANVFMFMNRNTGDIYVETVENILKNEFNRFNISPNISEIKLDNQKEKDINTRLNDLVNQTHKYKIKVTFNARI